MSPYLLWSLHCIPLCNIGMDWALPMLLLFKECLIAVSNIIIQFVPYFRDVAVCVDDVLMCCAIFFNLSRVEVPVYVPVSIYTPPHLSV